MEYWIIGPQFIGLLFLIIGWIQRTFPPKKPNSFYGYRMPSVMDHPAKWKAAQVYSGKLMMRLGFIYILAGVSVAVILQQFHALNKNSTVLLTIFAGISAPVFLIVFTEKHLNKVFKE